MTDNLHFSSGKPGKPLHVVIIGAGFGGLYAAKELSRKNARVTIVDRQNYHLFQPLLYQVATGGLSPGDIASPIRAVFSRRKNVKVFQETLVDLDPDKNVVTLKNAELLYDELIIAIGVQPDYFGNHQWTHHAPALKTVEDALEIRRRIFSTFEKAEHETDPEKQQALMTFVLVGAGSTGVELAGALGELAHRTLVNDFRNIDPQAIKIHLIDAQSRILPGFHPSLSAHAQKVLTNLGVTIRTNTQVSDIFDNLVKVSSDGGPTEEIPAETTIWTAGIEASQATNQVATKLNAPIDKLGRIKVSPQLQIPGHSNIYIIGDMAQASDDNYPVLPGVAQVAMQQGRYAAKHILTKSRNKRIAPFRYKDKGTLAVIGRNQALASIGKLKLKGRFAWLIWVFVHISYLIEYDNRLLVMIQWAFDYVFKKRGARLITDITTNSKKP